MITTETFKDGRSLGRVIWSGQLAEGPVNMERYLAHRCWSRDVA